MPENKQHPAQDVVAAALLAGYRKIKKHKGNGLGEDAARELAARLLECYPDETLAVVAQAVQK